MHAIDMMVSREGHPRWREVVAVGDYSEARCFRAVPPRAMMLRRLIYQPPRASDTREKLLKYTAEQPI